MISKLRAIWYILLGRPVVYKMDFDNEVHFTALGESGHLLILDCSFHAAPKFKKD